MGSPRGTQQPYGENSKSLMQSAKELQPRTTTYDNAFSNSMSKTIMSKGSNGNTQAASVTYLEPAYKHGIQLSFSHTVSQKNLAKGDWSPG